MIAEPSELHGGCEQYAVFLDLGARADDFVNIASTLCYNSVVERPLLSLQGHFDQLKLWLGEFQESRVPPKAYGAEQLSESVASILSVIVQRFQDILAEGGAGRERLKVKKRQQ